MVCNLQYVGKSETQFNIRLNNYRSRIKNCPSDKLMLVEKHFRQSNHDFKRDTRFTLIEKLENTEREDIRDILLKREDAWITYLQTIHPKGFNSKTNNQFIS